LGCNSSDFKKATIIGTFLGLGTTKKKRGGGS